MYGGLFHDGTFSTGVYDGVSVLYVSEYFFSILYESISVIHMRVFQ